MGLTSEVPTKWCTPLLENVKTWLYILGVQVAQWISDVALSSTVDFLFIYYHGRNSSQIGRNENLRGEESPFCSRPARMVHGLPFFPLTKY